MRGFAECRRCRLLLPLGDFDVNISAGRRRFTECKVCRHQRLARLHERAAAKLLEARRRRREREMAMAQAARAAAGKD